MNSQYLSIARFIIKVTSECNAEIIFEEGYKYFTTTENTANPDITIKAFDSIPKNLSEKIFLLFEVKNNNQNFFSIYKHNDSLKLFIYSQEKINTLQQIAILNKELNEWEIYCLPDKENKINPLLYPLGSLILYYLTVKFDAIMIHSSGIFDGNKGRIFSGFSGAGKSTMAGLWQNIGSTIINDDRLIIRRFENEYIMFNTPMHYADIYREAPLHTISLIHHSPENIIKKINGALAVSSVMAHCIQHSYNNNYLQHHLDFLSELCNTISIYSIGFKPDHEIIELIKEHAG
ncbi:MAG TPA: hypothetical protein PKK00_12370 [Bacteroidales bacterium]|nr:hypothetical protein [Bacteroidales bacterium]HPS18023.1 hypothetical protein [Bacteroidales bacterium]